MKIPRILITSGEPAGIGVDLCLALANHPINQQAQLIVLVDQQLLQQRQQQIRFATLANSQRTNPITTSITTIPVDSQFLENPAIPNQSGYLYVLPQKLLAPCTSGELNPANSPYVLKMLNEASDYCLQGLADALITLPVHKGVINQYQSDQPNEPLFTGHTEYLRDRANLDEVVMMLACNALKVALVTTHLPLREVAQAITADKLERVFRICHDSLRKFFSYPNSQKNSPKISILGLNPHAGEDGYLGDEEKTIINPVIQRLNQQEKSMQLTDCLSADTAFCNDTINNTDLFIGMYHDQVLPILKYCGFRNAVNMTLGLPYIRCSVDHGTALPLAGTTKIDTGSLNYTLQFTYDLVV